MKFSPTKVPNALGGYPTLEEIVTQCIKNGTHMMEKTFICINAWNGSFRIWSCRGCNLEEPRREN